MRDEPSVWKGLVAGISAGLIGSLFMNIVQSGSNKLKRSTRGPGHGDSKSAPGQSSQRQGEPATVKAASDISRATLDRDLTPEEREVMDPVMHYALGAAAAAAYGVAVEFAPVARSGLGVPFGGVVWLLTDEVAVPALGWSKPPWRNPLSTHVFALGTHVIYGLTTELSRRRIREMLA
jgi:putative membrane protein